MLNSLTAHNCISSSRSGDFTSVYEAWCSATIVASGTLFLAYSYRYVAAALHHRFFHRIRDTRVDELEIMQFPETLQQRASGNESGTVTATPDYRDAPNAPSVHSTPIDMIGELSFYERWIVAFSNMLFFSQGRLTVDELEHQLSSIDDFFEAEKVNCDREESISNAAGS